MIENALHSVDHGEKARRLLRDKYQFPGAGQRPTYVLTIDEALEFLDCLPDRYTDDIKAYIRTQFLRVTGGDPTLHDEIDRNAKSTGPVQQLAREAVGIADAQPSVDDTEDRALKKRRLLAEVVRMEKENTRIEQENFRNMKTYLEDVVTSEHLDDRERQLLKDLAINSLLHKKTEGGTDGNTTKLLTCPDGESPDDEITVSEVVAQLHGHNYTAGDLKSIGKIVADKYRTVYQQDPKKVRRTVNGTMQDVNCYFKKDLQLMQAAANEHFARKRRTDGAGGIQRWCGGCD